MHLAAAGHADLFLLDLIILIVFVMKLHIITSSIFVPSVHSSLFSNVFSVRSLNDRDQVLHPYEIFVGLESKLK
jgi:hypothetical protein